jgi:hypothetical protein
MKISLTRLTKENMYDKDLVSDVIFDSHELLIDSLKNKSSKLFLQGVDLYKNKKNPDAAIDLLKQSVLVFPQVNTYYEIGQVMMDMQANAKRGSKRADLIEALQAYKVAEHLQYQPTSMVYYNMACADNLLGSIDSNSGIDKFTFHLNQAVSDLRSAFQNGFSDTTMLQNDKRLASVMKTDSYKQMISELHVQKKSDTVETIFSTYKAIFPTLTQPFVISADSVDMRNYNTEISFDFARFIPEMENTEFSRDVSHDYYVVGKLTETPIYTAIIYTSTEFGGEGPYPYLEPHYIKLVTYAPNGYIIDSRLIACNCTEEKVKAVRIENNIITTEDYKISWKYTDAEIDTIIDHYMAKNPGGDTAVPGNTILKKESIGKETYKIADDGKIVEESAKVSFK